MGKVGNLPTEANWSDEVKTFPLDQLKRWSRSYPSLPLVKGYSASPQTISTIPQSPSGDSSLSQREPISASFAPHLDGIITNASGTYDDMPFPAKQIQPFPSRDKHIFIDKRKHRPSLRCQIAPTDFFICRRPFIKKSRGQTSAFIISSVYLSSRFTYGFS